MADITPTLSVYMLAYNHGKFIEEAIQSVVAQKISYTYELVIGDDASSDETQAVCDKYAQLYPDIVRYIRQAENQGAAENSRQVLAACRGKYLARLEGDDFMVGRTRLQRQVQWLEEHPDCMLAYGRAGVIDESRTVLGVIPVEQRCFSGDVLEKMVDANLIPACTSVYRAEILKQLPEWRSQVRYGDYVANTLAADKGTVYCLDEVISSYRRHGNSMTAGDSYEENLRQLMDIHCHFIINDDLSARGIQLSREALLRKMALLTQHHRITGDSGAWSDFCSRYEACFEPDSPLARRFHEQLCTVLPTNAKQRHTDCFFSIVLTTYNRPAMLLDALRSVAAQKLRDFEVVLVSDHGDPVEGLLAEFDFPLTYIRKGLNEGLSAARNTALAVARGQYICYLDDDDFYRPEHLQELARAFKEHPAAVVYSAVEYASEQLEDGQRKVLERTQPFEHERFDKERLFIHNYIPVNTWAHPRWIIDEVGEFDTSLSAFEDWDMLLRMAARHQLVHVPVVTAEVRNRQESGEDGDHMLSRERGKFVELYQEIYRRHSDLASERVRKGRATQLRALGVVAKGDPTPVRTWLAARTLSPVQRRLAEDYVYRQSATAAQLCAVILDLNSDAEALASTLESMQLGAVVANVAALVMSTAAPPANYKGQWCQTSEQSWVDDLNQQMANSSTDWVVLLQAGEEFAASGLQMAALELQASPECRAIFCDELYRQGDSDFGVALRPDFSLDYLLSFPRGMATHWLYDRAHLMSLGGFDAQCGEAMELDFILRLVNEEGAIGLGHIAEPLVISPAPVLRDSTPERAAILKHLQHRGYPDATVKSVLPGQYQIDYAHLGQPLVSIVVVMCDELAATQRCVMSVLETTLYASYEILLIDNNSQGAAVRDWLTALEQMGSSRLQVLRSTETLSRSEANNQAALNANGDYLLLLRPDVAVLDELWLSELMNHAQRPEVGLVGARTVDAEGKITHAGLVLGLRGPAGSVFVGEPLDTAGYMQRLQVDLNVSAVSDSCMLVRKSVYVDVGGMDAATFADEGAALDLCLRVTDSGHMLVWTPRATLLHGAEVRKGTLATHDQLYARWLPRLARDPAYNANLSLVKSGGFQLTDPQISWRPLDIWRPVPVVLAHPADLFGCGHYRIIQPFSALREAGMVDGALSQGLMHVADLERYAPDTIILQRQIGDERLDAMQRMKAFSNAFKVYELDDYLPNLPMKSAHRHAMPKDIVKSLKRGIAMVDRFVVSTEPLAEAFAGYHPDIRVVANRLDPRWWDALPAPIRNESGKPRVGWAGGASHTGDLDLIFDVVRELAEEVEWIFFGMCPDKLRPYVHEFHQGVSIDQYPLKLASLNLDLALAPVEENLFNECKSNLRLLEYGACGYPVVCSDVRCYAGDLPATRVKNRYRDWVDAIRMHLCDPPASQAQGKALYEAVKTDWMLSGAGVEAWQKAWLP